MLCGRSASACLMFRIPECRSDRPEARRARANVFGTAPSTGTAYSLTRMFVGEAGVPGRARSSASPLALPGFVAALDIVRELSTQGQQPHARTKKALVHQGRQGLERRE